MGTLREVTKQENVIFHYPTNAGSNACQEKVIQMNLWEPTLLFCLFVFEAFLNGI